MALASQHNDYTHAVSTSRNLQRHHQCPLDLESQEPAHSLDLDRTLTTYRTEWKSFKNLCEPVPGDDDSDEAEIKPHASPHRGEKISSRRLSDSSKPDVLFRPTPAVLTMKQSTENQDLMHDGLPDLPSQGDLEPKPISKTSPSCRSLVKEDKNDQESLIQAKTLSANGTISEKPDHICESQAQGFRLNPAPVAAHNDPKSVQAAARARFDQPRPYKVRQKSRTSPDKHYFRNKRGSAYTGRTETIDNWPVFRVSDPALESLCSTSMALECIRSAGSSLRVSSVSGSEEESDPEPLVNAFGSSYTSRDAIVSPSSSSVGGSSEPSAHMPLPNLVLQDLDCLLRLCELEPTTMLKSGCNVERLKRIRGQILKHQKYVQGADFRSGKPLIWSTSSSAAHDTVRPLSPGKIEIEAFIRLTGTAEPLVFDPNNAVTMRQFYRQVMSQAASIL